MKRKFYYLMLHICWLIEDIHDIFNKDISNFYPSSKWEDLYQEEVGKLYEKSLDN